MTTDTFNPEETDESNLVRYAREEMTRAGLFEPDADYEGQIAPVVLKMVESFASFGHSGGSAELSLDIFNSVVRFRPLGPLTDNPDEWQDVDGEGTWQSRRRPDAFSSDGGKTYYLLDDPMDSHGRLPTYNSKEHKSA